MSKLNEFDIQNMCRTCMGTTNLKSLYEEYSAHETLNGILTMCTAMEFHEDDGLPFKICFNCINELYRCYKFAIKCRETDTALRISLQPTDSFDDYEPVNYLRDPLEIETQVPDIEIKRELDEELDAFEVVPVNARSEFDEEFEINENIPNISGMPVLQDSIQCQCEEEDEVIECKTCQKCFESHMLLKEHQKWECEATTGSDSAEEKQYTCVICDEAFTAKLNLKIHLQTHSDSSFACTLCDKSFNKKTSLKIHFRTHSGEKPYSCEYCDARFRLQHHLTGHLRTQHSKARATRCKRKTVASLTHNCDECGDTFTRKFQLNAHLRMHAREKRSYSCSICSTTFTNEPSLTFHMYTHTGAKPYVCTICDASFNLESNLTCHLRIHSY